MLHKALAIINGRLVVAEVSVDHNSSTLCKTCGGPNKERSGWYGCWVCGREYNISDLKKIEETERKVAEYTASL